MGAQPRAARGAHRDPPHATYAATTTSTPFELRHLVHKPTTLGAIVLVSNLGVVGFMA